MEDLKLVHSVSGLESAQGTGVRCQWKLSGQTLEVAFEVRSPRVHANPAFGLERSQLGLWDWDVVELFLCVGGSASGLPYYEFQVSPLGQFFELKVLEPRKRFEEGFVSGFRRSARSAQGGNWVATMGIPLDRLGWKGDPASLKGNFFAILGEPSKKTHWSLFLPEQERPDFHLPAYFKPFF